MRFETPLVQGWLIGDPHFGKDFRNGTPLHRRGERETMQLTQFLEELYTPDVNMIVMVGDLFDKPFVPLPIINIVAREVVNAADQRDDVLFVFIAGNHDRSRQVGLRGAWELFELAVSHRPNIHVFNEPAQVQDVAFFPWEWVGTAETQVDYFTALGPVHAAIGHWDCVDFGNRDHMVPVKKLLEINADINIYTGHDHGEGLVNVDGVNVHKTGSMQPYAHGEGDMYVTLTLDEIAERDDLKDKCVRVILAPGEDLPQLDCLQLSYMREGSDEEIVMEVGLGNFDIHAVLENEFNDNEVPAPVRDFIKERMGAFA